MWLHRSFRVQVESQMCSRGCHHKGSSTQTRTFVACDITVCDIVNMKENIYTLWMKVAVIIWWYFSTHKPAWLHVNIETFDQKYRFRSRKLDEHNPILQSQSLPEPSPSIKGHAAVGDVFSFLLIFSLTFLLTFLRLHNRFIFCTGHSVENTLFIIKPCRFHKKT